MNQSPRHEKNSPMKITLEQQKTISTPLRSRLIAILYENAMTSTQVAEILNKNTGTIYYHIQQLLKNDILVIEKTEVNKGVIEKYYRARAMTFSINEQEKSEDYIKEGYTNIYLSEALLEKMNGEITDLLLKYGSLSYQERHSEKQEEYTFEYGIRKLRGEEEDEKN